MIMEPFLGQIALFPYNIEPRGWERCDGRQVAVNHFSAPSSLLGRRFGGASRLTFALPKMNGPVANTGYFIALTGVLPSRNKSPGEGLLIDCSEQDVPI
jgi:microcystin-dependent protein